MSLERLIGQFKASGRDCTALQQELDYCINVPAHDIDHGDMPYVHPDLLPVADKLGIEEDDILRHAILEKHLLKPVPKTANLFREIDEYLERYRQRSPSNASAAKQALDLFKQATGEISIKDISVDHYRQFLKLADGQGWNETTISARVASVKRFLQCLETDKNMVLGFIRNKEYARKRGEGKKVQYSLDEMRTALKKAMPEVRLSLLLGLNCGFYWSDINDLSQEHIVNGHIVKVRSKNEDKTDYEGNWLLWQETIDCLALPINARKMEDAFRLWRQKHGLKEHKALRKGMAQLIQDHCGDEESRLYRAEYRADTHNKFYVKQVMSPVQVAKLDKALTLVHDLLFN